jgi:hypothetical protein
MRRDLTSEMALVDNASTDLAAAKITTCASVRRACLSELASTILPFAIHGTRENLLRFAAPKS